MSSTSKREELPLHSSTRVCCITETRKSKLLPVFHAFTRCNTVSAFTGQGKKTVWVVRNTVPEVTDAFLCLVSAPRVFLYISSVCHKRFVVMLYGRTNTCFDVNLARLRRIPRRIPPTWAALEQYMKRCTCQGGYSWGQTLVPSYTLPSQGEGQHEPLRTTLQEVTKSCDEYLSCRCKKV